MACSENKRWGCSECPLSQLRSDALLTLRQCVLDLSPGHTLALALECHHSMMAVKFFWKPPAARVLCEKIPLRVGMPGQLLGGCWLCPQHPRPHLGGGRRRLSILPSLVQASPCEDKMPVLLITEVGSKASAETPVALALGAQGPTSSQPPEPF